ncbi:unnamed protein product [Meganyctiphanes norvegica]|uniref:Peptidyl-prolyl cis-trans isomerase, rhodopsin-specific isozyme n=1 Tax=Meganyctiphanes norvegica TaxID=48144 RepID=A0AAV2QGM5_MEGNR
MSKKPLIKKPMDEDKMKLRFIGNAPLWKIFVSLITIPTLLIGTAMFVLQNEGGEYKVTHKAFFDIEIAGKPQDRVVIGLFGETVPRTVQNFLAFAGDGYDGKKYQGSKLHRAVKQFMVQGGDVVNGDGTGSISIYGPTFPDENFLVKHTAPGYISMANTGSNTNGCQFMISLVAATWMDKRHVAFGKVIEGMSALEAIEMVEGDWDNKPIEPIVIVKSGKIPVDKPFMISNDPYNFKDWALTIGPALGVICIIVFVFDRLSKIMDRGIDMHDNIIKELEEKMAKEEAAAAAAGGEKKEDGEVIKGKEEDGEDTTRRRHVE